MHYFGTLGAQLKIQPLGPWVGNAIARAFARAFVFNNKKKTHRIWNLETYIERGTHSFFDFENRCGNLETKERNELLTSALPEADVINNPTKLFEKKNTSSYDLDRNGKSDHFSQLSIGLISMMSFLLVRLNQLKSRFTGGGTLPRRPCVLSADTVARASGMGTWPLSLLYVSLVRDQLNNPVLEQQTTKKSKPKYFNKEDGPTVCVV